jgi:subtilisin family serine protease
VLDCTATGRISDAAAGMRYAARAGANVIVVAFGSSTDSTVLRDAVVEATDTYGALVVASAGNEGSDRVQFPAAYPSVLAVGGSGFTNPNGVVDYRKLASFSNFGPDVDLLAPGTRLIAPVPPALCGQHHWNCLDGPYARASGTSFAAPLVAGAAALLYTLHPDLSPAMAVSLLTASGSPLPELGRNLLDVAAALQQPLYGMGLPATSSDDSGGEQPGPGDDTATATPVAATPTPPPPVTTPAVRPTPRPPNTGGGPGEDQ